MIRSRQWVAGVFFLVLVLALSLSSFALWRVSKSQESFQASLVTQIEEALGAQLELENTNFSLFPSPRLKATKLKLKLPQKEFSEWTAREARFTFSMLPLLLGKAQLSGVRVRGGEGSLWGIPLEKIELKIKGLGPHKDAPFVWKARVEGTQGVLSGKGKIGFGNRAETFWKDSGLHAQAKIQSFTFPQGMDKKIKRRIPEPLRLALWEGEVSFKKEKFETGIESLSKFYSKNIPSNTGPLAMSGETKWLWNLEKNSVEFKRLNIVSPFAEFDGMMILRLETGEIEEARLHAKKVILDELIRNFPIFQSLLPLDTGLSGESDFDLSLQGTLDYLSLHANWNLTPAVVTYGKVFSKPKDLPMRINFDFLLKASSQLSGDFSIRFKQATIKGALAALDLKTGAGEITFLTNKFELRSWKNLLVPFAAYRLSGSAKALLSCKGNLLQWETTERMANFTFDDVTILSPEGKGIRKAKAHIDISPLSIRINDAIFTLGNSPIQMETQIYNADKKPQGTIQITSAKLEPFVVWDNLKEFQTLIQKKVGRREEIESALNRLVPKSLHFENFSLNVKLQEDKWTLHHLTFEILGGQLAFQGEWDRSQETPNFWIALQSQRMSLAPYFEELGGRVLEGNLFFDGKFKAQGANLDEVHQSLAGEGNLSITNGEWAFLDLTSPLKGLVPLQSLPTPQHRSLSFHDLKANWRFKDGKFETDDFILNAEDFWIEGKGNLSLAGVVNSRLEVYLSKFLTEQMFKTWEAAEEPDGKQLGPIPLLLVGNVKKPEPRIDDRMAESFLESVRTRKFRNVLHKPFLESSIRS